MPERKQFLTWDEVFAADGATLKAVRPCPKCQADDCEFWQTLLTRTFTEQERLSAVMQFHPEPEEKEPNLTPRRFIAYDCPICWKNPCPLLGRLLVRKFTDVERRRFLSSCHKPYCEVCRRQASYCRQKGGCIDREQPENMRFPPWWQG
jgi:hypothetical protein